jgi:hypothetical protein
MTLSKLQGEALAFCALIIIATGGFTYVQYLRHEAQAAKVEAATRADTKTVATGQTDAQSAAATIADRGASRGQRLATLHEEHDHALQAAPGAGQLLDPGFVQRLNDRLCEYAAYADDPGCAGLREFDTGQLSKAHPANPTP